MSAAPVSDLQSALSALAPRGVLVAHRIITVGDEDALLPAEAASIASPLAARRRASGAARIAARELLAQLGHADVPIIRAASGEPLWPAGIVGSLAHDDAIAVAAVAPHDDIDAIGIDVEPAEPLPADMIALVVKAEEQAQRAADPRNGRLLFAAKEAVYKAAFPRDRAFLEFHDITVDLGGRAALTRTGRTFALRWCLAPRIVVVATE